MALDKKDGKKLCQLCIKMTNVFNDIYISTNGYIISTDIEKPFLIQIDDTQIQLFKSLLEDFKFLRIWNLKEFKRYMEKYLEIVTAETDDVRNNYIAKIICENKLNCIKDKFSQTEDITPEISNRITEILHQEMYKYTHIVTSKVETKQLVDLLSKYINEINSISEWDNFLLSDNETENEELILSLFKKNDYINFLPKHSDGPEIILTKSLLPLVSEKNYTSLYYATKKLRSDLFLIVFDFDFDMFRLYMLHHYIPINSI